MNINPNINRITTEDIYLRYPRTVTKEDPVESVTNQSESELIEPSKRLSARSLLSPQESATLHLLFGAEKPQALSFYGKTKVQQIHKGHLIDILS
jgi:hypothetical protein